MRAALEELERAGATIEAVSGVHRTTPRDVRDQPDFDNAACRVRFDGTPRDLLDVVKGIERDLGRVPGRRRGPRVIDIDILLTDGGEWHDDRLDVPHPRLHERRFALVPLLELDADLMLPDGRLVADVERALRDDPDQGVQPRTDVALR